MGTFGYVLRLSALATAIGILVLAGCSSPGSQVVDGEGIAGVYTINGADVVGTEYSGTVTIVATSVDLFEIEWLITGAIHQGTGRLEDGVLTVDWRSIAPRTGVTGSGSYSIEPDGDLVGTRTTDGVNGVTTEHIFQSG